MSHRDNAKITWRKFLKQSALALASMAFAAQMGATQVCAATKITSKATNKVIVIGFDGMDPGLTERMMDQGLLPNLNKLRQAGGYTRLGTSIPPLSPVAWSNFITGAGPGTHGIFDFIHRNPQQQYAPFFSAAETIPGQGSWEIDDYKLQLDFWPFGHKPAQTLLRRQGTPFWDYLDQAGIWSSFYNLPANYPPSVSQFGHHRCLSGMGTTDMLGGYGTYQHFGEDGPIRTKDEGGGMRSVVFFENHTSKPALKLIVPKNVFLKKPEPVIIDFLVHRDLEARSAVIEIQGRKILLKEGHWSRWTKLDFEMSNLPMNTHVSGICRFYLQEVAPNFRLYVSPINNDPSNPANQITEPPSFITDISKELGLFHTTGFQEDHKALTNKVFTDDEYATQADYVLQERLNLLQYALKHYDDGLLFFYFSSTDLQAHMFWWDSNEKHPTRSADRARQNFDHLQKIYQKMDEVVGDIMNRYGDKATIFVMSDHGFANFKRQFNLNSWLRKNGYIQPAKATSLLADVDWSRTRAYGLGINGLYLNLKGRERDGIVDPGSQREELLQTLISQLEAVRDTNGQRVISKVHRGDKVYAGPALALAPDLIVGYSRGYRVAWDSILGSMSEEVLQDNDSAWSATHCIAAGEVPGVLFSNKPIAARAPSLVDMAPSILTEFGLEVPSSMVGKSVFLDIEE